MELINQSIDIDKIITCPGSEKRFPKFLYQIQEKIWDTDLSGSLQMLTEAYGTNPEYRSNPWIMAVECQVAMMNYFGQENDQNESELNTLLTKMEGIVRVMYDTYNPHQGSLILGYTYKIFTDQSGISSLSLFSESIVLYAYYYLVYSLINLRKQERVKGAYYFRKSWKYFEQAIDIVNKHKDHNVPLDPEIAGLINFGSGFFHFIMSLVPPSLQFVLTLVGFTGNRTHSLKELQACMDSGCSRAVEASILMAFLKKYFVDQEEEGNKIIERLERLYPNSIIVRYLSGFTARLNGDLEQSIQHFTEFSVISRDRMKSVQLYTTSQYHMGYCSFMMNNWEQAAKHFEIFLNSDVSSTGKRFRPYTAYQLGFCYWKLDRKNEIEPLYLKAKEWIRPEQSYDRFAQRKMDQYLLEKQFSNFDEVFISCGALNEGRLYKQSLIMIETLIPLLKEPSIKSKRDLFALYYFLKAEALRGLKQFDRSKQIYEKAIAEEGNIIVESYVVPYSWTGLAEIALEQNAWAESEKHFNKAKSYSKYDWAQLLSFRIYSKTQLLECRKSQQQKPKE